MAASSGLCWARDLAARGHDDAARQAYFALLQHNPGDFRALIELAALARGGGFRAAARSAYAQAVRCHPGELAGHVNFANLLFGDGEPDAAAAHYRAALAIDPDCAQAHQGMARILADTDPAAARRHWQRGFAGHAVVRHPHRGTGPAATVLLLVSARGGNIPTQHWIDDRRFHIIEIFAECWDIAQNLPDHDLIFNAIGDADLCGAALDHAEALLTRSAAPVINRPAQVRATGRMNNARRLAGIAGVITPCVQLLPRAALGELPARSFPLLLRSPGFHTGQHFHAIATRADLALAGSMPGEELLAIQLLDARGADGMARKYRVMAIAGALYPLHLAIAADWKVHYFTSDMAANADHRAEEQRFLADMPGVLGPRAMTALQGIAQCLGLDYAGIDFALSPGGDVLLFEANATMRLAPPPNGTMWDYRRPAFANALQAAQSLVTRDLARCDLARCDLARCDLARCPVASETGGEPPSCS